MIFINTLIVATIGLAIFIIIFLIRDWQASTSNLLSDDYDLDGDSK